MKLFLLTIVVWLSPVVLMAQGDPPPTEPNPNVWLVWLLGPPALTAFGQLLRQLGIVDVVPGWARPLITPLFGALASYLSPLVGFIPDFGPITGALLGTVASSLFSAGKKVRVGGKQFLKSASAR